MRGPFSASAVGLARDGTSRKNLLGARHERGYGRGWLDVRSTAPPWRPRAALQDLPGELTVVVEAPRGTFVKRRADGTIDFVSPIPCPYNYGSTPDRMGGDGDPLDVIAMGPRKGRGASATLPVRGIVGFIDAGSMDHKVLCGAADARVSMLGLRAFFHVYAAAKRTLNALRGRAGETRFLGVHLE